jgi:23S rRNA (uracil1939-C5)-methyltransferase
LLVQTVLALAHQSGARTTLDLFAGSGNFSLPLAAAGYEVSAFEVDARAIAGLQLAALEQGLKLKAECQDLRAPALEKLASADLVIANPPRAGLGALTSVVASLAKNHVLLCCCSADSFTRDAAELQRHGFQLARWFAIDMFPGTDHVEVLGHFQR